MAADPRIASRQQRFGDSTGVKLWRFGKAATLLLVFCGCSNQPPLAPPPVSVARPVPPPKEAVVVKRPALVEQAGSGSLPQAAAPAAGPIAFEAAAPDGRWVVFCQARSDTDGDGQLRVRIGPNGELGGDRLVRYLALGSDTEEAIDDFLASSSDGRFLAIRQGSRTELVDLATGTRTDLRATGIDLRRDPSESTGHRSIVFHESSLFFLRPNGDRQEVVERSLIDGGERVLYACAEPIARIVVDATANSLVVTLPAADVNGNGRFDLAYAPVAGPKPCPSPLPRYLAPRAFVDPLGFAVIDRESLAAQRVDDLAIVFGKGLLRRELSGALVLERAGHRTSISDATCKGRVLWADPTRDELLIGCALARKPGRASVELVTSGKRVPLAIEVAALAFDEPVRHPIERLVPLYPGADTVIFDADKKRLHRLRSGDGVLATSGRRALVRRGRAALIYDVDAESESVLAENFDPHPVVLRRGPLAFASPWLVDVAAGRLLTALPGRPVALANSGALLLPVRAATTTDLAEGPLTWNVAQFQR